MGIRKAVWNRLGMMLVSCVAVVMAFSMNMTAVKAQTNDFSTWDEVRGDTVADIVTDVRYPGSDFSVCIDNDDYKCCYVCKNFEVKPNTHYRASVMARCSGYELKPNAAGDSGAKLGLKDSYEGSECYKGTEWKKLTYDFTTGDETSHPIVLWNGLYGADCKGKVYYSAFTLEEVEVKWDSTRGEGIPAVDRSVKYNGSDYSISIVNEGYYCSYVSKTFDVKPDTHYRASVMAKCENYELHPEKKSDSGASIGLKDSYEGSGSYTGSEWKRLTYEFNTGENQTTYDLALWNGMYAADCRGTVYFSDFRLEESPLEYTNEWNVMVVVFKNIKAPVVINGKNTVYKDSFTDEDAQYLKDMVDRIYVSVPTLSDERWKIRSVDLYTVDDPITELKPYDGDGYCIDYGSPSVSASLDKIIAEAEQNSGRHYNQMVVFVPINSPIPGYWLGLGGSKYRGIWACQLVYNSGSGIYDENQYCIGYTETAVVHEMLHCVENATRGIDPDNFVQFHANIAEYEGLYSDMINQQGWGSWGAYHSDYMRAATPDGRGVNEKAFLVPKEYTYTTVYGTPVEEHFEKKDIQRLKVAEISDKEYTGKAIKPNVVIKDGSKKLKKGRDYTLSYMDNKEPGRAAVIITGKGKYAGTYAKTFIITTKAPEITCKKVKTGSYKVSWTPVKAAEEYQVYVAAKGSSKFKLVKTVKGSDSSVTITAKKGSKVRVRSCRSRYPQEYYSDFSETVKLK